MKPIIRIKEWASLNKLNNAEYYNFMAGFIHLVEEAGPLDGQEDRSALGFEWTDYQILVKDQLLMRDLLGQSRIQEQTEELAKLDKLRNGEVRYLFSFLRTQQHACLDELRQAAITLYNIARPSVGCQRLPVMQKTAQINALLYDLRKEDAAGLVGLLGLNEVLDRLEALNGRYMALADERTHDRAATKLEDSKSVRKRMSQYYDYLTAMAFAQSVIRPTEVTARFVKLLNALIDEIRALYNLRIGQVRAYREKKKEGEQPDT